MSNNELIDEQNAYDRYHDMLNDAGLIQIGSLSYSPSHVLASVDPIAYRIGFSEFVDYLLDDGIFVQGWTEDEMPREDEEID